VTALRIVFLGLSITSSWGNGHATTYRGLIKALLRRGHLVTFLERDVPWYAAHRDALSPAYGRVFLYADLHDLENRFGALIARADAVIVGSYVPQGPAVLRFVLDRAHGAVAFYDIDTPVTVARLAAGVEESVAADLLPHLDLYLSFTGGPLLDRIRREWGVRRTAPLYCSVDPETHAPAVVSPRWDLGYLGTYSADRQTKLDRLLVGAARLLPATRVVVAGPQYPAELAWPANVQRIEHLPPDRHAGFYGGQRFTLNLTRADMVAAGWSPSVRLFEAAACGVPVISDAWPGLDQFFRIGSEILIAASTEDVVSILTGMPEDERRSIAAAARQRVLLSHSAACRAEELEHLLLALPASSRDAARDGPSPQRARFEGTGAKKGRTRQDARAQGA
jgi:spore maturation protein CgeB